MPKGSEELTNARKEEIVNACAALYETMGFKDITIRDIGAKTSFTRTSIYNYFQTKEEIFLALLQREHEAWIADLEAILRKYDTLSIDGFAPVSYTHLETKIGGKMIAWLYPAIEKSYALEAWVLAVHGLSAIRISASALTCT